jgi:DnaD/phage-associated family protein
MTANHADFETIQLQKKFIDDIMPNMPSDYLKIYIAGLCLNNHKRVNIDEIVTAVSMDTMVVVSAFEYLQKMALVTIKNQDSVWIEFNDALNEPVDLSVLYTDKQYNDQLQECFGAKIITTNQFKLIYDWTDVFKLPKDVCLLLIKYCQQRKGDTVNIQYMHAVAKSWAEINIDSVDAAKNEIEKHERLSGGANKVLSYIGGFGRMPSKPEMALYTKWTTDWGFTLDSILMAIKDIGATNNPSFKYIDKILEKLKQGGRTTARTISEHQDVQSEKRQAFSKWLSMVDVNNSNLNFEKVQGFVDEGFDYSVIALAFEQAAMRGINSLNYVETILHNWKNSGLTNALDIQKDIDKRKSGRDQAYAFYKQAGFDNVLTGTQIDSFEKWIVTFDYDMMLAVADYSKHAKNANQYMNKVFSSLKEKGITTKSGFLNEAKKASHQGSTKQDDTYIRSNYTAEDFQKILSDVD